MNGDWRAGRCWNRRWRENLTLKSGHARSVTLLEQDVDQRHEQSADQRHHQSGTDKIGRGHYQHIPGHRHLRLLSLAVDAIADADGTPNQGSKKEVGIKQVHGL